MSEDAIYDVAVIGAGPVGSTAANLAARHDLRCVLIEPSHEVFSLPRAIHFDADIMRIFQFAGLAERIEPIVRATSGGVHLGVDGEPIRQFRVPDTAGSLGWRPHYMFFQPELDALLRAAARERAEVDARFGWRCDGLSDTGDEVVLTLHGEHGEENQVRARYVIAADGAASPTRARLGLRLSDYDFDEPWVIVDGQVPGEELGPDYTIMYCDPARPATYVPGPGRHRRWEFMLLPGETGAEFTTDDGARQLVASVTDWLGETDLAVGRVAVYRFHALVAENWRAGRVFLAGDAAHQTPPFYGQGMCHGIRDVRNLLWKLAALRDGRASEEILDSYQAEREPHVRAIIEAAVANGRYICTLDPMAAAQRDQQLRDRMRQGADVRSFREVIPGLGAGLVATTSESEAPGLLFVQPTVTADGAPRMLDDMLGDGFALVSSIPVTAGAKLDWFINELGGRLVQTADLTQGPDRLLDSWFREFRCVAALVRPDRYVFGVAVTPADIDDLLEEIRAELRNDALITEQA
jgi:3-(3-hydroxy-phenyl)propionate hydroxylase